MSKLLNEGQVWALSDKGDSVYKILLDAGVDADIAFEMALKILGESSALELEPKYGQE